MNRIKELRNKANIKQAELAKQFGITQGALSGWENGRYEPDISSLKKMAKFFNVSIDYLLGDSTNTKTQTPTPDRPVQDQDEALKYALFNGNDELPDEAYDEVKQFAEFVKNKYQNNDKK